MSSMVKRKKVKKDAIYFNLDEIKTLFRTGEKKNVFLIKQSLEASPGFLLIDSSEDSSGRL